MTLWEKNESPEDARKKEVGYLDAEETIHICGKNFLTREKKKSAKGCERKKRESSDSQKSRSHSMGKGGKRGKEKE